MQTDWVLIGRLAGELKERLRGARVDDAGLLPDGRVAISFRSRGSVLLLAFDLFAPSPVITLEEGEFGIASEPHFVRLLARSLRGMVLVDAAARRGDRLLRLTFAARSRFGVGEELECYAELVPRFGNLVLAKEGVVIGAYREFAPAENSRRVVLSGIPYALPPVPEHPLTLAAQPQGAALEYLAQLHADGVARSGNERAAARRRTMLKQLDERERRLRTELASLSATRRRIGQRERLRAEGEAIYETLHTLPQSEQDAAKERAAKLFAEYKKLGKSLPHVDRRERSVRTSLETMDTLRWEAERTSDGDLDAVEAAVGELSPRRGRSMQAMPPKRKRAPLELRTPGGSRIIVGRSPVENADLTFRVARPNDLWFHTQRVPGAHVILARDDRAEAPPEDLELAASLAAYYSRAKASTSVPVDYTLRKHVRKQRAAPPGLVWYTNAKTIVAEPKSIELMEAGIRTPSSRDL